MRIKLSLRAVNDFADIWDYSEKQWEAERADRVLDDLRDRMIWLITQPSLWKRRGDLGKGLFSYSQESNVIYFRKTAASGVTQIPSVLEIVRILRQRMDVQRHL